MRTSTRFSSSTADKIRAVVPRSTETSLAGSNPEALDRQTTLPWETEGEFELEALVVSQKDGEIVVRVPRDNSQRYLTISGFLPGNIRNQRWRLSCLRESGQIELLDGQPC